MEHSALQEKPMAVIVIGKLEVEKERREKTRMLEYIHLMKIYIYLIIFLYVSRVLQWVKAGLAVPFP